MKLLLFSGGVESTCLAKSLQPDLLLTVNYGQRCAEGEIRASSFIAEKLQLRHEILYADIKSLGVGDLVGLPAARIGPATEFWPYRNQFLITLAAMRAAKENFQEIIIGTVSTDKIHEDGNPEFIENMNKVLQQQNPNLSLNAPAINSDTFNLVKKSALSEDLLRWTFSCYSGSIACGQCRGCLKTIELMEILKKSL